MTKAFEKLAWLLHSDAANGAMVKTITAIENNYDRDNKPLVIPANTSIRIDFGGDFGFYGIADITGVLHKVKVDLDQLHKVDLSDYV